MVKGQFKVFRKLLAMKTDKTFSNQALADIVADGTLRDSSC